MKSHVTGALLLPIFVAATISISAPFREKPSTFAPSAPKNAESPQKNGGEKTPSRGKPRDDKAVKESGSSRNATDILYEFWGIDRSECENPKRNANGNKAGLKNRYRLEFMIAILPDPIESRLGYMFDRNLEAIQRAIETDNYVLDRFDLPWKKTPPGPGADGASGGAARLSRYTQTPGVILFRNNPSDSATRKSKGGADDKLLALFIVGETPTAGVHKAALKNALDQIKFLSRWGGGEKNRSDTAPCLPIQAEGAEGSPPNEGGGSNPENGARREIRIIGPTFSGSEDSLELALQSWRDASSITGPRPAFRVISGSAQSISQSRFSSRLGAPGQQDFFATTLPSRPVVDAFNRYLVENDSNARGGKIAILKEANTVYGQSSLEGRGDVLDIPFPLHISQLRNASEKAKSSHGENAADPNGPRQSLLSLTMEDGQETNDVVPLFSPNEPATVELMLSKVLSEINREKVRYVGVISTDIRDCIFLIGAIRKNCPDTTVFTFNADLLFLHPDVNLDLRGVIVITPYPLFGLNQFWNRPDAVSQNRLQFSSHVSQGVYNATLALLNSPNLLGYGPPFEATPGDSPRSPALWISMVGKDDLWPVKTLAISPGGDGGKAGEMRSDKGGPYAHYSYAPPAPRTAPKGEGGKSISGPGRQVFDPFSSSAPKAVVVALLLLIFWLPAAVVMFFLYVNTGKRKKGSKCVSTLKIRLDRISQTIANPVLDGYRTKRELYLLVCIGSLIALYVPVTLVLFLPCWVSYAPPGREPMSGVLVPDSITALVAASAILLLLSLVSVSWLWVTIPKGISCARRSRHECDRKTGLVNPPPPRNPKHVKLDRKGRMKAVAATLSTLTIAIVSAGALFLQGRRSSEHAFLYLRTVDLTSGVSPLFPILLIGAAGVLCSFCAIRRWSLIERANRPFFPAPTKTPIFLSFENGSKSSFAGLKRAEYNVTRLLSCAWYQLPGLPTFLVFALFTFLYVFIHRFVPTLEGPLFDWLLKLSFCGVLVALAIEFLRFVSIWANLRRLLHFLSSHPLFSRPAAKGEERFAGLPKLRVTSPAPSDTLISLSVYQAIKLFQSIDNPEKIRVIGELALEAERSLLAASKSKARGDWRDALRKRCETRRHLASISKQVALLLEAEWARPQDRDANPNSWARQAETYLGGRTLAFLHYALAHMQNLAVFVTAGMLLLLLAITSYPLQPHDLILLLGWLLILSVVIITLAIFIDMDRDKVLSVLAGSVPGRVEWNFEFLSRIFFHGVLPILTLLSLQFPEALQQILSWFKFLQGGGK